MFPKDAIRLELKERIEEGTLVNFRVVSLKLHGAASVALPPGRW